MTPNEAIAYLEQRIPNPTLGLPEEIFYFVSRITPLINVDLLIKNKQGQVLLTWRADNYGPPGWHVPGGIIRFQEAFAERIRAVAKSELRARVKCSSTPISVNELILGRRDRGHFISLLYPCWLLTQPDKKLKCNNIESPRPHQWLWHDSCPINLIPSHHKIYKSFFRKK